MTLQLARKRVRHRPNRLFASLLVLVDREVRIEKGVSLRDRDVHAKPVACRGDRGRIQPMRREPSVDRILGV